MAKQVVKELSANARVYQAGDYLWLRLDDIDVDMPLAMHVDENGDRYGYLADACGERRIFLAD